VELAVSPYSSLKEEEKIRKVTFHQAVDYKDIQRKIIKNLMESEMWYLTNKGYSKNLAFMAMELVKRTFKEESTPYNKLMAKCLCVSILHYSKQERDGIREKIEQLDPTDDHLSLDEGLPF